MPLVGGPRQALIVSGEQGAQDRLGWSYRGRVESEVVLEGGSKGKADARPKMEDGSQRGLTLQKWIEKCTGRKLSLLTEAQFASEKPPFPIFVGSTAWQGEFVFSWKRLGLDPHRTAAVRLNVQRNLCTRYVPGVSSWYATFKRDKTEPLPGSRGWLVLEQ